MTTRVPVSWDEVELGDVVTLKRGYDLPASRRQEGQIPIVSSSGITGYHDEAKVQGPGVVTGRYGTLGKVYFIEEPFWPLNTTLYVEDFKGNDPRFVSYFLHEQAFGRQSGAAAVPGVNRNILHRLPVVRPPLLTQQKIANVIAGYDQLIENNTRRIQILEKMAQAVYREWFIKYRYLGHEDVPLIDSALGPIPKGWEVRRLQDRFEVVVGSTPSRARPEFWADGTIPWVNSSAINLLRIIEGSALISDEAFASTSTKLMPSGATLVAVTGATLGQVSRLEIAACGSQNVCGVFDMTGKYDEFIYLALSNQIKEIANQATGGAQQHINRQIVAETPVVLPPLGVIEDWKMIIRPMFELIAGLLRANENLRATRDLLLPRLISGEIDVSDLDIEV